MLKNIKARGALAYKIKKAQIKNETSKQKKMVLLVILALSLGSYLQYYPEIEAKGVQEGTEGVQEGVQEYIIGEDIIEEGFEEIPIEEVEGPKIEVRRDYIIHEKIYKAAEKNNIDINWIITECEKEGVNPEVILNTIYKESTFNPKATNSKGNSKGTDRGIAMFNDHYKGYVTDECAFNWKCVITTMVKEVATKNNLHHWYGSKKVLSQGFPVMLKDRK